MYDKLKLSLSTDCKGIAKYLDEVKEQIDTSTGEVKKSVSINFRTAKTPVALNMEAILANCGGDPAKENEMLRAMGAK